MKRVSIGVVATLLASASAGAAPSPASQALAGKDIALASCSYCHVVAADQRIKPTLAQPTPSFEQIANKPDTNATSLRRFITTTHWDARTFPMTMPNPILLDEDTDQVVSYILSLRSGAAPVAPSSAGISRKEKRVEAGEYIALQLCSYCHVVSSDRRYRPELDHPTPSFQEIANNPANTSATLRHFITTTHWDEKSTPMTMPSPSVTSEEADEVAAYILSLRSRH